MVGNGGSIDQYGFMIATLERINEKMDSQDKKINDISTAIQQLIAVDIEIRELKQSNKRAWDEIDKIKAKQENGGCPTFKQFKAEYDSESMHTVKKIEDCEVAKKEFKGKLDELSMKPAKKWEQVGAVAITATVMTIIGYIAVKLGLK